MLQTPFHAYYLARTLANYAGDDKFIPAYASSRIEIYPYQIAAAQFALRSNYLRGCILCDEGSLGKTYEALLIATQKWYEGKDRQLLILPVNMIAQWIKKIEDSFTIPYILLDSSEAWDTSENKNPFVQDSLVITTYDFAAEKADYIKEQKWDLIIFDEADCLNKIYTGENKMASCLKNATDGSFKLLLTPTPIEMDIRDIYGLIYFIDETILPDIDYFYTRYFRKPENFPELASWVSKFCFRTLKSQVTGYVNFSNRIPYTISYELTDAEKVLYARLDEYLAMSVKIAYPKQDRHRLTMQFYHILSSSAHAFNETLVGVIERLKKTNISDNQITALEREINLLKEIKRLTEAVDINGKTQTLLSVLKKCFSRLRQIKTAQKAIIFIDSLITLKHLYTALSVDGYSVLTYSGSNSRDYSIMENFRNDKSIQLLLATDDVAKGIDMEFCPVVVNYDMLSNATQLEQRISRCHRQGQQSDVMVINLLCEMNYADVRYLELINKRVLQFDGIFGMSDAILGNFNAAADDIFESMRYKKEILSGFENNLKNNKRQNIELVEQSEDTLFTTFTKEIANKVTVTPQYIKDKANEINNDLWEVVKWYFERYNEQETSCHFEINEQQKTVTANNTVDKLPILFHYWTGSQNRPYRSLAKYGMDKEFKPHTGRVTLSSVLGRTVLEVINCADEGTITVNQNIENCIIGLYKVSIRAPRGFSSNETVCEYDILVGKTENGAPLTEEECRRIMNIPVVSFSADESESYYWLRNVTGNSRWHELDSFVPEQALILRYIDGQKAAQSEEIERMKLRAENEKARLEHVLDDIRTQVGTARQETETGTDRIKQLTAQKKLKVLQKDLKQSEEKLFIESMKIDVKLDEQINELIKNERLACDVRRHFVVRVVGCVLD